MGCGGDAWFMMQKMEIQSLFYIVCRISRIKGRLNRIPLRIWLNDVNMGLNATFAEIKAPIVLVFFWLVYYHHWQHDLKNEKRYPRLFLYVFHWWGRRWQRRNTIQHNIRKNGDLNFDWIQIIRKWFIFLLETNPF